MKKMIAVLTLIATSALGAGNTDRRASIAESAQMLNGAPRYLGRITAAGSSTTNASTAVPFTITSGTPLLIICTAAMDVLPASTVTATTGVDLAASEKFYLWMDLGDTVLAIIGTGSCDVWKLQ